MPTLCETREDCDVDVDEFIKGENTDNISISTDTSLRNVIDIELITQSWFGLMIRLNASPKLRQYFANERYDEETNEWKIDPTEYTTAFLGKGIIIYNVQEIRENGERVALEDIIITMEMPAEKRYELEEKVIQCTRSGSHEIVTTERWPGCGMVIPKHVNIQLCPDIVWPVFNSKIRTPEGNEQYVTVRNTANKIIISQQADKNDEATKQTGFLTMTNKIVQGQTKGSVTFLGEVVGDLHLQLPYTCASFDILTRIDIDSEDSEEEFILFTS